MSNNIFFARVLYLSLLALVLFAAAMSCNKGGSSGAHPSTAQPTAAPSASDTAEPAPAEPAGATLYAKANCAMCHGSDRSGKAMGPSLLALRDNWDAGKLTTFLKDPQGYTASDERLKTAAKRYPSKMRPITLTEAETQTLAEWLLAE